MDRRRSPRQHFMPNGMRAKIAVGMLGACAALDLVNAGYGVWLIANIEDLLYTDRRELFETTLSSLELAASIACAVAFMSWFYRAFGNAKATGLRTSIDRIWTIAGWIIPILNWFKPYQIMAEMARHAGVDHMGRRPIVGLWWLLFLGSYFVDAYSGYVWEAASDVDEYRSSFVILLAANISWIACAALSIRIVQRLTAAHDDLHTRSQAEVFE